MYAIWLEEMPMYWEEYGNKYADPEYSYEFRPAEDAFMEVDGSYLPVYSTFEKAVAALRKYAETEYTYQEYDKIELPETIELDVSYLFRRTLCVDLYLHIVEVKLVD